MPICTYFLVGELTVRNIMLLREYVEGEGGAQETSRALFKHLIVMVSNEGIFSLLIRILLLLRFLIFTCSSKFAQKVLRLVEMNANSTIVYAFPIVTAISKDLVF